jgi:hypothetical protein
MGKFRIFIFACDALLAVAAGVALMAWAADMISLADFARAADDVKALGIGGRAACVLAGLYVVLLNAAYLFALLFLRKYETRVVSANGNVTIGLALSTAEDSLRRAIRCLPEVEDVWVRILKERRHPERPVRVVANVSAWEGVNLKDASEKICEAIQLRIAEMTDLGAEPVYEVNFPRIVPLDRKNDRRNRPGPAQQSELSESFQGPQYPIDADFA